MSQTSRLRLLAGAAAMLGVGGSAWADSTQAWTNADEVRSIVAEMMADAETRSSLLQSGGTAGHDGQFFLASADGNFRLNVAGLIQFRYYANFYDDIEDEDDFESGFQTRRTRLTFSGHIFEPNLFYKIQGDFWRGHEDSQNSGNPYGQSFGDFELEDAYMGYRWDNGFQFRAGQFKLPFMREQLVDASMQLVMDRSSVHEVFSLGRAQGIEAAYQAENWLAMAAFSDGMNSWNSDFGDSQSFTSFCIPYRGESDWALTGRFEYKFAGTWDQFKDFTGAREQDFGFLLGVAGHAQGTDAASSSTGRQYSYYAWTIDLSFEGNGWNIFAAANGSYCNDIESDDIDQDDYGIVIQGGFLLPGTQLEIYGRYDIIFVDTDDRGISNDDDSWSTVTAGVNWYHHGHASKWTIDFIWFLDDGENYHFADGSGFDELNTEVGYLPTQDSDEFVLRIQWQLMF